MAYSSPYGGSLDSGGNATTAANTIGTSNLLYVLGLMNAGWVRYQIEWSSIELAYSTTSSTAVTTTGSPVPITVSSLLSGMQVGNIMQVDVGTTKAETVTISAVSGSTVTATFSNTHTSGFTVSAAQPGDNPVTASSRVQAYNWQVVDDYLTQATSKGMYAVFVVQNAPTWHQTTNANTGSATFLTAADTQYFVNQLTLRYNGSGANSAPAATFAAIELGNEGYDDQTTPAAASDGQLAAQLLQACYSTIKTNCPNALVGCAAMLQPHGNKPTSHFTTWTNDFYGDNTQGLGTVNGKNYCDYLNFHFYNDSTNTGTTPPTYTYNSPEVALNGGATYPQIISAIHQSMVNHGDSNKQIWNTEIGWTLYNSNKGYGVPDATLANYIANSSNQTGLLYDAMNSGVVQRVFYYNIGSLNPGNKDANPTTSYTTFAGFITQYPTWSSNAGNPVASVSPTSLTFTGTQNGSNPASQTVTLSNTGSATGTYGYSISYSTNSSTNWLAVSPGSGTLSAGNSAVQTCSVTLPGLAAGTYTATLTLSVGNSVATVAITLAVSASSGGNTTLSIPSNISMNYYHESMGYIGRTTSQITNDLTNIQTVTSSIKVYLNPLPQNAGGVSHSSALSTITSIVQKAKTMGFHVVWVENIDQGQVLTDSTTNLSNSSNYQWKWADYSTQVIADAASASTAGADEFLIGNEIIGSSHYYSTDPGTNKATTIYNSNFPTYASALVDSCRAKFSGTIGIQEVNTITQMWQSSGLLHLDVIYYDLYEKYNRFQDQVTNLTSLFPGKVKLGEVSTIDTLGAIGHYAAYTENDWSRELMRRYDTMRQNGVQGYCFTYGDPSSSSTGFGIRLSTSENQWHDIWNYLTKQKQVTYNTYFYDTFTSSSTNSFTGGSGGTGGELDVNSSATLATATAPGTDYVYRGRVKPYSTSGSIRLLARYTDANNYYAIDISVANNAASLLRMQGGTKTTLASITWPPQGSYQGALGTYNLYDFELRVQGTGSSTSIAAFVDTYKLYDAVDSGNTGLNSTTVGFLSVGGSSGAIQQVILSSIEQYGPISSNSSLAVSPSSLSYSATAGGNNPASQSISIANNGTASGSWTGSISYGSGSGWLSLASTSGTVVAGGSQSVAVNTNISTLATGTYTATITITMGTTTATVSVTLIVSAASLLSVSSTTLSYTGTAGTADPSAQTVTLTNNTGASGSYTTQIQLANGTGWLSVSPSTGTIASGATSSAITVTASNLSGNLSAGTYTATITFTLSGNTATVSVTLTVQGQVTANSLTVYLANATSGTLSTANQLYTQSGSPTTTWSYTLVGTATGFGEICAQGSSAAWAALTSIGAQTGNGFFLDAGLANQILQSGNWSSLVRLNCAQNGDAAPQAGTLGADLYLRASVYTTTTKTYTSIVLVPLTGQTIPGAYTTFTLPATTTTSTTTFGPNDVLYIDYWANITGNSNNNANQQIRLNRLSTDTTNLTGDGNTAITTPGYTGSGTGSGGGTGSLTVSRTGVTFTGVQNSGNNPTQNVTLTNVGTASGLWSSSIFYGSGTGWLLLDPASGSLAPGNAQTVSLSTNLSGLAPGSYFASIGWSLTNTNGVTSTTSTSVTLTVTAAPILNANFASLYNLATYKEQCVLVYSQSGQFLDCVRDAPLLSGFKETLNASIGAMRVQLPRHFDNFDLQGAPGAHGTIAQGNVWQYWLFGPGLPATGLLRFQGIVDSFEPQIADTGEETVVITLTPRSSALGDHGLNGLSPLSFGTAGQSSTYVDPLQMMEYFFNTVDPLTNATYTYPLTINTSYSATSSGNVSQYQFTAQTLTSAFTTILLMLPANWFYRCNPDNTVTINATPTVAQHVLYVGQHCSTPQYAQDYTQIKNAAYIAGSGVAGARADSSSLSTFGERLYNASDNRVTDQATANILAQGYINIYDRPQLRTKIRIPDYRGPDPNMGYDIESLRVGDSIQLVDQSSAVTVALWDQARWDQNTWDASSGPALNQVGPIVSITYQWDYVDVEIGALQPSIDRNVYIVQQRFQDFTVA